MARKRSVFFSRGEPFIKFVRVRAKRLMHMLIFLALFLVSAILPVLAKVPREELASWQIKPSNLQIQLGNQPSNSVSSAALVQQGRQLYEAGQFAEAARIWQQAAQAYQSQGDRLNQAMVLSNLSLAYQELGQWSGATQAIAESLKLLRGNNRRSIEQLRVLAQALNTQGSLQLSLGQAELALSTWEQAAATYAQVGDRSGAIRSQINQALAMQSLGLARRALNTLKQVNQTLQAQPNSQLKAAGLRSLGDALQQIGELKESRQILQQSLEVARASQSAPDISTSLVSLGNVARSQQDTKAALEFYQQAASASVPITKVQALLNQLSLLLETQQWSDAQALLPQIQAQIANLPASQAAIYARINYAQNLTRLKQSPATESPDWSEIAQVLATAIQQAKTLGDKRSEAYALGNLGGLYEQTQQWLNAQDLTQQALLLAQSINASDIAYRWQWQLGRILKAQGDTPGAIAAYTEAVNTLQSLRSDLVAINSGVQFDFRKGVEPVYRQLVDLLLQPAAGDIDNSPTQENLVQARQVIESLQLAELVNLFRENCLTEKPVQIDQVDHKAAVIYPIILDNRLEVILSLPQQPLRHYPTSLPQSQLKSTLKTLSENLTQPETRQTRQFLPDAQKLYDWLIRPAEDELETSGVKTLVFVLEGPLRNIPMAVLHDGQQFLVEKYSIALTPGLQLLETKPLAWQQIKVLMAGLSEPRQDFPALPNVALELEKIQALVPNSKKLINEAFTSSNLQKEINSSNFPVIHLATHGKFSSNAEETFILTWDKRFNLTEFNNLLQSRDQTQSSVIELLVLSSCQTAAGDERAGLGLAGIAVRTGARSTVGSLWSIEDAATASFMVEFYKNLEDPTLTKAEALRRAQLSMLRNQDYSHPFFWAPLVLVGNWL